MDLTSFANAIRFLSIDAVEQAKSGHPGMPMGMADIASVLWTKHFKFLASKPRWWDRDRFILSNGHGSMLLYSLLYLTGFEKMTLVQIKNFRQYGFHSAGHPELAQDMGIETTTGPLGQGIANGVGMALGERILNATFGDKLVDHYTYVFCGDGCLMEGLSQEAISFAGHLKLNKLILFFDDNQITIDGKTSLSTSDDVAQRMASCHWHTITIDGHDHTQIDQAIAQAKVDPRPSMIICKTTIGFGSPNKADSAGIHGAVLGTDEVAATRANLSWPHPPFVIPDEILAFGRKIGQNHQESHANWHGNWQNYPQKDEFERRMSGSLPDNFMEQFRAKFQAYFKNNDLSKMATRKASGEILNLLQELLPELIGGSADLSGSNNTKTSVTKAITASDFTGNYIYYGVREHGMAAIMNGLRLHGGIIPYGGTFLTFSDYARPAMRLSALMEQKVIYVMTHDSIGLGEDGPTHQPIEHLMSLRLIPNLLVLRPCDIVEVAQCWLTALEYNGPTVIALSRQGLPLAHTKSLLQGNGPYLLNKAQNPQIELIASGSEVSLALEAANLLKVHHSVGSNVYSMPLVDSNNKFTSELPIVVIEAGRTVGWNDYLSSKKEVISLGVDQFGISAPIQDTYKHFGLTVDFIVKKVLDMM